MLRTCSISQIRDNLGHFSHDVTFHGHRYLILKNGREVAALVSPRDVHLLEDAFNRRMDYKAYQIAQEMMRWRIVRDGLHAADLAESDHNLAEIAD